MGEKATAQAAKPAARASLRSARSVDRPAADPALASHDALGNAALGRLLRSGRLAPKLAVSQPADPSERHADVVAERLLAGESCGGCDAASPCASCAARGLHRSATGPADAETEADAGRLVSSLGSGIPLAPSLRSSFEVGLGHGLGDVRVHTSREASEIAQALHARAFTVGNDVAFASGAWSPDTPDGRRLLAHELAHVTQQQGAGEIRRDAEESASEGGVCEPGEGANVCVEGDVESAPAPTPPRKPDVSVDDTLRKLGILPTPRPFGPEPAPPAPAEPDAVSGADVLSLPHPLEDYPALFAALLPGDYAALEAAMRRRERIRDTQIPEPRTGSDLVMVSIEDLLDPALTSWRSHAEMVGEHFEEMVEHPENAEEGARLIAENDARRIFLETRLWYDVDIRLEDPDAEFGGDTHLTLRVGDIELAHERGSITLASLEPLSGLSLQQASERAGILAAQVAEAATLLASVDEAIEKTQSAAAEIQASPEDSAFNEVIGLKDAAEQYLVRLEQFAKSLDPANDVLQAWMNGAATRFRPVRDATIKAFTAAETFRNNPDNWPATTLGEANTAKDKQLADSDYGWPEERAWNALGRVANKINRLFGEAATGGGMGMLEQNAQLYRSGQISYTAWKKNNWYAVGKVGIIAAVTALTAGRGRGLAVGLLGVEEGAAGVFVTGTEKGVIGGFAAAVSGDVYSSLVAWGTSDPGVATYQRSSVVGPSGWIVSAVTGGAIGGPLNVVLTKVTESAPGSSAGKPTVVPGGAAGSELDSAGATRGAGEIPPAPEAVPAEVVSPLEPPAPTGPSLVIEEPPPGSGVLAPEPPVEATLTTRPVEPEPPRAPLQLREGSSAAGRQLSNQSLDRIEQLARKAMREQTTGTVTDADLDRFGKAVRDQTAEAVSQADFDRIGRSLGNYRNSYIGEVGERLTEDLRNYGGQLVVAARGTATTPGMDLLALQPSWPPELVLPEVKMGVSAQPYRIGESNLPVAYRDMETFYREVYAILGDRNVPVGIRARIKMALDEGRIRWELDAVGNVRAVASGTNALPGNVTINMLVVPRR